MRVGRLRLGLSVGLVLLTGVLLQAQIPRRLHFILATTTPASNPIDSARRSPGWASAGATVVSRSTVCSNISAGASAATINTAIANCGSNQVVLLAAGTYNLSTGLIFDGKSNVTLRGAGPDATFLIFTAANNCGGIGGHICVKATTTVYSGDPGNTANWTAGYARGSTSIVLSSKTNLQVGALLFLDQLKDSNTVDPGDIWICSSTGNCTQSESDGIGRTNRPQLQIVKVTSISGGACPCTIGISPGIYQYNWRSSQTPQAWWSSAVAVSGVGIEDLSISMSGSGDSSGIALYHATESWVQNVRSVNIRDYHVRAYLSAKNTIRDSYFFDTQLDESDSYGFSSVGSCDFLVENNIFQSIPNPIQQEPGCGHVVAYNYSINNDYPSTWMQPSDSNHGAGSHFDLFESNDGVGFQSEDYYGTQLFTTAFRNRYAGWQTGKTEQTVAVHLYALSRYENLVGNVLGTNSYHTIYETNETNFTNATDCWSSIFALGLGDNCFDGQDLARNDPKTRTTLLRWGNYDTVTDSSRFLAAEVPSGITPYANPVPATQTLPASQYLSSKPTFFGSVPWPAIGPDVTGGSEPNVGGHNLKIPARRCFENVMGGAFGDTTAKTFNADLCYPSS